MIRSLSLSALHNSLEVSSKRRPIVSIESLLKKGIIAAVLALATASSMAEEGQQQAKAEAVEKSSSVFFDSVDVDLVNLEVVVTDKKGRPVTGLKREDFEIYVDGRRVDIANFFAVTEPPNDGLAGSETVGEETAGEPLDPATAPGEPAATLTEKISEPTPAAAEDPSAEASDAQDLDDLVILIDNRNISLQNRKLLFVKLRELLENDTELAHRIMLVTLGRKVEVALPFTTNRQTVLSSLTALEKQTNLYTLSDVDRRMFMNRLQRASLRNYTPTRFDEDGRPDGGIDSDFVAAVQQALELARSVRALAEQRTQHVQAAMTKLGELCGTLGGLTGRKAVLYLSDGLPMRPADSLIEAWTGKFQTWVTLNQDDMVNRTPYAEAPRVFRRLMSSLGSSEFDLRDDIHRLATTASDNRVIFYPISNGSRSSGSFSAATSGAGLSIGSGSGSMNNSAQTIENFTRDASLLQLAEDTGGVAITRSSNISKLLEQIDHDFSNFYSLGYNEPIDVFEEGAEDSAETPNPGAETVPTIEAEDTSQRSKLEVKVHHEDIVVRHGNGFYAKSWRQRLGEMTRASALFEVQDNPLRIVLDPGEQIQEGERYRVPILLTIPFDEIRMVYQGEHYLAQLTALIMVQNERDGGLSKPQRIDFPIKIQGQRILEAAQRLAGYQLELEMAGGPKRVTVGVRDHFARTESTVNLDLVVGQGSS